MLKMSEAKDMLTDSSNYIIPADLRMQILLLMESLEKRKFKVVEDDICELVVQLTDDGCPDSERFLRILVYSADDVVMMQVSLLCGPHTHHLLGGPINIDTAVNLLYGVARVKVVKTLEIVK